MKFTLAIQPLDEGGYFAQIEELPAVLTEGETLEEVRTNIQNALKLYLSYLRDNSSGATIDFDKNVIREPLEFASWNEASLSNI